MNPVEGELPGVYPSDSIKACISPCICWRVKQVEVGGRDIQIGVNRPRIAFKTIKTTIPISRARAEEPLLYSIVRIITAP